VDVPKIYILHPPNYPPLITAFAFALDQNTSRPLRQSEGAYKRHNPAADSTAYYLALPFFLAHLPKHFLRFSFSILNFSPRCASFLSASPPSRS